MKDTTIAVDLAKSVFQVAVSHKPGRVDAERRLSREKCLEYLAKQPPATVLLEACGSAHHWARQLQPFGHTVRLLPAHDVHRYVRRSKTDRTDAKALLEADRNEEIHAVPVKTIEQQSIAALHRMRSTWLAPRTSRINTVRGLLREFGIVIPVGAQHVVPQVRDLLASSRDVPDVLRTSLSQACDEIRALETQMRAVERQLAVLARDRDDLTLLQTIPGIGVLTATALGGTAVGWRTLENVMDIRTIDTSVPRARQLRDEPQSGRYPTRGYQQRQPSLERGVADQTDLKNEEHEERAQKGTHERC